MNVLVGFTGVIIVLIVFYVISLKSRNRIINHPDDFFLSKNNTDSDSFGTSQISYSLQMATVYPYFYYAFVGMWWLAAWNTLFFLFGILFLHLLLPKFNNKSKLDLLGTSKSLHAFIANLHSSPKLRPSLSIVSIIAFTGLASFEIIWGAKIIWILFSGNNYIYYFSIFTIGLYVIIFLWNGGLRAALISDKLQLVLSYVGLHLLISWVISNGFYKSIDSSYTIIATLIVVMSSIMFIVRIKKLLKRSFKNSIWSLFMDLTIISSLSVMIFYLISSMTEINISDLNSLDPLNFSEHRYSLIAFALLPLFFQFVDFSNWQRMASLIKSNEGVLKNAKKGILMFMLESPLSWLFPVLLGICAVTFISVEGDKDPWIAFLNYVLSQPEWVGSLLALLTVLSVVSIFLSTVDSLVSAIGYTYAYDFHKESREIIDSENKITKSSMQYVIKQGQFAMSVFLGIALVFFITLEIIVGADYGHKLIGLFLAFFAALISLTPAIIFPAIFSRVAGEMWVLIGVFSGCIAGIVLGILSVIYSNESLGFISTIAALSISTFIYILGVFFNGKRI